MNAQEVCDKLKTATTHAEVLDIMTGVGFATFRALDETPGAFDPGYNSGTWFTLLRQVRNDPTNDLFERLTQRAVVSVGLDGASQPMLRYRDELHLADHERSVVAEEDRP